jgi:hypothetical protein
MQRDASISPAKATNNGFAAGEADSEVWKRFSLPSRVSDVGLASAGWLTCQIRAR